MKAQNLILMFLLWAGMGGAFDARCNPEASIGEAGVFLKQVTMPADTDNIFVQPLSSDKHSSQSVVFVRKLVPTHKHLYHSESVYVLSGEGELSLNGKVSKISAGHFIYIPQGAAHGVKTTSKEPLKVLSVQAPEFFGKDRVLVN